MPPPRFRFPTTAAPAGCRGAVHRSFPWLPSTDHAGPQTTRARLGPTLAPMAAPRALTDLAARQDGVITSAQCLRHGMTRDAIRWMVASGRWQRVHRGVLITHTGPLTWRSRARAAVLYAGAGAALSHDAAAYLHRWSDRAPRLLDVTIPRNRSVRPQPGLRIHRPITMPMAAGRLRTVLPEDTALDLVAAASSEDDAISALCAAVRARVPPWGILAALETRPGYRKQSLLMDLLGEVEDGAESALEHGYRRDVERAHGLPTSVRQRWSRVGGRWTRTDCLYEDFGVRVELDGQLAHPGRATDEDVWRDNAVVLELDEVTLRYRWRHVRVRACRTADQVGHALQRGGWTEVPLRCGRTCELPGTWT